MPIFLLRRLDVRISPCIAPDDLVTSSLVSPWRRLFGRRGFLVAGVAVLAASAAGILLRDYLDRSIFILFAAPIAMAAWYGGRGPALLATVLGVVASDAIFLDHDRFLVPSNTHDVVAMGVFVFVGLTIEQLSVLLRRSRDEARDANRILQNQALELELRTLEAQNLSGKLEEANEQLQLTSQTQLAEAQAIAKLGSWEWDVQSDTVRWSDEMFRLYGLEPGSVKINYERYRSLLHPEDRESAGDAVRQSLETGDPFSFDHRVIRPDGEERVFHARGRVVGDENGRPVRMYGTGQDVTDVRRASAALQKAAEFAARQATAEAAAEHLNRVLKNAPVAIAVLIGPEHRFQLVNDKGYDLVGRSMLGRTVMEALPELAAQGFFHLLDKAYETNTPFIGNEMFARLEESGAGGFFNFVFQPLSDAGGVYAVLVVATDVSDLVRARNAAEASQKEALAASRAKSDFLARMSHELRTPLAAIMGYGELLTDGITGPVNEEQKRQLQRIRSSANHLLSIIDEILTLARVEAGKEKAEIEKVNIGDLMESVASMSEPLVSAKGLTFDLAVMPSEIVMHTDPVKLRQVLLNLISNAVKYTDKGTVSVVAMQQDGAVDFLVEDTGVGVSEDHLEKIFEPFWQVEATTTRRAGGTGLGLAVTRQFVDLLGGTIEVKSSLGDGSTFRVSLPASPDRSAGDKAK